MIQQICNRSPALMRPEGDRQLTFSPIAWLKLMFFLHVGDTEVGGFAVTAEGDPLHVLDIHTLRQRATVATIELDDAAVADHFDRCVDLGLKPERFARLWWHTHPGQSPLPSATDEETFARVFGGCDWSIMFIVSRTEQTYVRLAFNAGPGGYELLESTVDWSAWPLSALQDLELDRDPARWAAEYEQNVHAVETLIPNDGFEFGVQPDGLYADLEGFGDWWIEEYGQPTSTGKEALQ
jgi:proteasome lid subunit RPN8/RPN11